MKVGDLVRRKSRWAVVNPWMKDTILDNSKNYGLVVGVGIDTNHCPPIPTAQVVWIEDDRHSVVIQSDLEVVCK